MHILEQRVCIFEKHDFKDSKKEVIRLEKENPLVSIITPCYNGENVMHRLLDSILSQTYSNIEFILINDGSTDHSEEIWYQYEKKFNEKRYKNHLYSSEKSRTGSGN